MGRANSSSGNNSGSNEDQTPIVKIVSPSDSVYHQITKAFGGKDILDPNTGQIDRLKLGAIIFNDRDERKKIESNHAPQNTERPSQEARPERLFWVRRHYHGRSAPAL
mmetsp:Transcript_20536/g.41959  ORF Transcript_20536/g.41959 Transcript_20536/m.41959 type:complete len:108 (+) Transcript_20536:122-445(+)